MLFNTKYILVLMLIIGFAFISLTTFAPSPEQRVFGVYFSPSLSQKQILGLLSGTSLSYAGFTSKDNIILLSGEQSALKAPELSDKIWFVFNPNGFKACGDTFKKIAFVK